MTLTLSPVIGLPLFYMMAVALLWSCFCRFVHMTKQTNRWIRGAFNLLATSAVISLAYPVLKADAGERWSPDLIHLVLLAGVTAVQIATSHFWRKGVPKQFQSQEKT